MCIREFGSRQKDRNLRLAGKWSVIIEQLNAILHAHTASMEALMTRVSEGMASRFAANVLVGGGGDGGFGPRGKIFRDIGKFSGEEGAWAEWALKFRIGSARDGRFPVTIGNAGGVLSSAEGASARGWSRVVDRCGRAISSHCRGWQNIEGDCVLTEQEQPLPAAEPDQCALKAMDHDVHFTAEGSWARPELQRQ